jgi:MraZ protein
MSSTDFLLGEFRRTVDDRFRLSLPGSVSEWFGDGDCILAKERSGALSLWNAADWQSKLDAGIQVVVQKMRAGRLQGRIEEVQSFGRLLSTRHAPLQLAGRGRLLIPEGFREFLGIEPGEDVLLIGAAVCLEIWKPAAWLMYLQENTAHFQDLFDQLSE